MSALGEPRRLLDAAVAARNAAVVRAQTEWADPVMDTVRTSFLDPVAQADARLARTLIDLERSIDEALHRL